MEKSHNQKTKAQKTLENRQLPRLLHAEDGRCLHVRTYQFDTCGDGFCCYYDPVRHMCLRPADVKSCCDWPASWNVYFVDKKTMLLQKLEKERLNKVYSQMYGSFSTETMLEIQRYNKGYSTRSSALRHLLDARRISPQERPLFVAYAFVFLNALPLSLQYKKVFALQIMSHFCKNKDAAFTRVFKALNALVVRGEEKDAAELKQAVKDASSIVMSDDYASKLPCGITRMLASPILLGREYGLVKALVDFENFCYFIKVFIALKKYCNSLENTFANTNTRLESYPGVAFNVIDHLGIPCTRGGKWLTQKEQEELDGTAVSE